MLSLICLILMLTASLSFDSTEWDFGKVDSESGTLFHNFRITNDSDEDFRLAGVVCSCSCVKAYIGRSGIKAGETVEMQVSVNPRGYSGKVEHSVVLYGEGEKAVQKFVLKMNINSKIKQ